MEEALVTSELYATRLLLQETLLKLPAKFEDCNHTQKQTELV